MVDPEGQNLIFILSTPRAGSTLLGAILGGHPSVLCPPESWLLLALDTIHSNNVAIISHYDHELAKEAWRQLLDEDTFRQSARAFALNSYNEWLKRNGKRVFVDKTPRYYHILPFIDELFPSAFKIWIRRNPLDVIASCKTAWGLSIDELLGTVLSPYSFDTTISFALLQSYFASSSGGKISVRYEELVEDPARQVSMVCSAIGLQYDESMLAYGENRDLMAMYANGLMGDKNILGHTRPHRHSVGRWRTDLTPVEVQQCLTTLGPELFVQLGYQEVVEEAASSLGLRITDLDASGSLDHLTQSYGSYITREDLRSPGPQQTLAARQNAFLRSELTKSEADRAARLEIIEDQGWRLGQIEGERNRLRSELVDLRRQLEILKTDYTARLAVIEEQGLRLGRAEGECNRLLRQFDDVRGQFETLEADHAARLGVIKEQGLLLGQVEGERNRLQTELNTLHHQFEMAEADRAARLVVIEEQGLRLGEAEGERNRLQAELNILRDRFEAAEADRAARLAVIEEQGLRLGEVVGERNRLQAELNTLHHQVETAETDRAARLAVIELLGSENSRLQDEISHRMEDNNALKHQLEEMQIFAEAQEEQVNTLVSQFRVLQQALQTVRNTRAYRLLRRLGRWKWMEEIFAST